MYSVNREVSAMYKGLHNFLIDFQPEYVTKSLPKYRIFFPYYTQDFSTSSALELKIPKTGYE
jgi:hypothetical protein